MPLPSTRERIRAREPYENQRRVCGSVGCLDAAGRSERPRGCSAAARTQNGRCCAEQRHLGGVPRSEVGSEVQADAVPRPYPQDHRRCTPAPTSGNQQPWKFLIVRDRDKITQMKDACIKRSLDRLDAEKRRQSEARIRSRMNDYFSAPVYIVVLTTTLDLSGLQPLDGPLAAGYLMLARVPWVWHGLHHRCHSERGDNAGAEHSGQVHQVCITPLGVHRSGPRHPQEEAGGVHPVRQQ